MKRLITLVGFLSFFLIGTAAAEESELSYSNVDISYLNGDVLSLHGDGYGVSGSVGFADSWFASLSYNSIGYRGGSEFDEIEFDIGYHWGLNSSSDFVVSVGYFDIDDDDKILGQSEADGYDVTVGVRSKPLENFEYGAFIQYYDGSNVSSGYETSLEGRYHLSVPVSFGIKYRDSDLVQLWGVDVRYDF